ncbi:hypothetical protein BDZ89DRAFT_1140055 [Hymenopellis radicata]|nr:hypothetical protein BDZ89DRAFT_1140055 [Hymenopellis radicata]
MSTNKYKIYMGRVSGAKEFRAFVTLKGVEGLVHVSNILTAITAPSPSLFTPKGETVLALQNPYASRSLAPPVPFVWTARHQPFILSKQLLTQ